MSKTLQLKILTALQDKISAPLQRIRGGAGTSSQSLKELRDRLRGLEATQKDVGRFRELSAGLNQTKTELQQAQGRVQQLARAMGGVTQPTRAMQQEFKRAVADAQRLKQTHGQQSTELQTLRTRLNSAGMSTRQLSSGERELRSNIAQTNRALTEQKARLEQVARQQQRVNEAKERLARGQALTSSMAATGATGMAVGTGALYAGAKMIAPGLEFDATMSNVQALSRLGKEDEALAALRRQARELGADTMFSATEAAQGQSFFAMAGFKPEDIIASMPGMLDVAKAGNMDLAQTADIASNILTGFSLKATDMTRVGDVLTAAFTRSNTSLYMLGETMKYAAPNAAAYGQDIEIMAAAAGKLGDAGIQGSMGGTALRAILSRLAAPPKEAAKALDQLGIKVKDAQGNMRPLPDLLEEIHDRTKKMGNVQRGGLLKHIAGEEAGAAMTVLTQQAGSGELQALIATLREAQGEAAATAKTMGDNLVGDLDELSSGWEDLGIQLQEQQNGALRGLVQSVTGLVGSIKAWTVANPELTSGLVRVAAVLAVVIAAGGALTLTLASILGPIVMVRFGLSMLGIKGGGALSLLAKVGGSAFSMLARGFLAFSRLLLLNPIGLAITAIALGAYLIIKYWEPIRQFFAGLWGQIRSAFDQGVGAVVALLVNWSPLGWIYKAWAGVLRYLGVEVPGSLSEAGMAMLRALGEGASRAWASVQALFTRLWSGLIQGADLVVKYWQPIRQFFAGLWGQVRSAFDQGVGGVTTLLVNWSPLGWVYKAWAGVMRYLGVELPSSLSEAGMAMLRGLGDGASRAWSAVQGLFTKFWSDLSLGATGGLAGIGAVILNWSPLGLFYQVMSGVMSYFGVELPEKFTGFGSMMLSGLVNGIQGMAGAVKDSITGLGDQVTGWFKEKLGIHSPSRVFMGFGQNISEGTAIGVTQRKPTVGKAVKGLVATVLSAGVAMAAGANPLQAQAHKYISKAVEAVEQAKPLEKLQELRERSRTVPKARKPSVRKDPIPQLVKDQGTIRWQEKLPVLPPPVVPTVNDAGSQPVSMLDQLRERLGSFLAPAGDVLSRVGQTVEQALQRVGALVFDTRPSIQHQVQQNNYRQESTNARYSQGGDHIEINIYPQAGQSSTDIAQAVRIEMERYESEKRARQRSSLNDY